MNTAIQTHKNWHVLEKLGILVVPGFLDADTCAAVLREMTVGDARTAMVGAGKVDSDVRRVKDIRPKAETQAEIAARLHALCPTLSGHFHRELRPSGEFQLLRYRAGDFYLAHRDDNMAKEGNASKRTVSTVAFLDAPGERYDGGALVLYGLLDNPKACHVGIPVFVEPGMLVAFRSSLLHEVARVERGERCTLAAWFV